MIGNWCVVTVCSVGGFLCVVVVFFLLLLFSLLLLFLLSLLFIFHCIGRLGLVGLGGWFWYGYTYRIAGHYFIWGNIRRGEYHESENRRVYLVCLVSWCPAREGNWLRQAKIVLTLVWCTCTWICRAMHANNRLSRLDESKRQLCCWFDKCNWFYCFVYSVI